MHWSMSAPAWGFFSTLIITAGAILRQSMIGRKKAEGALEQASAAAENAEAARENTAQLSNGFASDVKRLLRDINSEQMAQGRALRDHLQWHMKQGGERE